MIEHLVWFKLRESATPEEQTAMLQALRALPGQIQGIQHLACGYDFSGRSNGYQIGLVVRFTNREALDLYQPHPLHQAFVEKFKPLWEDVKALDFEA